MSNSEPEAEWPNRWLRAMARSFPVGGALTAVFLASSPFSGFLYRNRELVGVVDLWRYVVLYVGALLAVVVGISLVFGKRTGSRWSFLLGWCACVLFWYRDVKSFADDFFLTKSLPVGGPVIWAFVTLVVSILIYRLCERSWFPIAGVLFSLTLTILPIGQYVAFTVTTESYGGETLDSITGLDREWESQPDIYFLLVDGFGRQDVLREMFDIDTSGFVAELRRNGFVVADRALGAHPMTWLSVPAIFDQEYQALPGDQGKPATQIRQMAILAGGSRTHQILKANGYHFVTAATGWGSYCDPSPISEVEDCVNKRPDLDAALKDAYVRYQLAFMTPVLPLSRASFLPEAVHAMWEGPELLEDAKAVGGKAFLTRDILDVVDAAQVRDDSIPLFVFGHMWYTHPPFTLGPECEFRTRGVPNLGGLWPDTRRSGDDVSGYQAGIDCAVMQILELISEVDPSAVIVVQADHGPISEDVEISDDVVDLDEKDVRLELFWGRASVFSAVRLPERCRSSVSNTYAGTSTFKVIFDCLAGSPTPQISEQSHWAWWNSRRVVDLTDWLRTFEASLDLTRHAADSSVD